ncbi:MAG: ATP-dependent Clp protease ATP-binding subunit [Bacteroidaceae bacterium]|nr:ATP-dependent Clp protease ATP-binding subunit [Bacteroidaceae bacterium]
MATKFSPDMSMVLAFSKEEAERLNNGSVTPSHILLAMLRHKENSAVSVLQKLNIDLQVLKRRLEESTQDNRLLIAPSINDMDFDLNASRVIRLGALEARLMHSESIDTIHLLLAILKANDCQASNIMSEMNVTYASLAQIAHNNKEQKNREDNENKNTDEEAVVEYVTPEEDSPAASSTPRNTSSDTQTPLLDNFGTDLTKAAQENLLDPVVGRENEIERVAQILCRRKKNNPILIGEPGCGKSAIVEGLAQLIVKHRISRSLWDKRIVMLDMACVVAGTKYRGQFEERIRSISNELKNNPNVIVFIDEIHTIVGAGNAEGSMDAANILKPALARGEFQCIGATTTDEFKKTIEKDGALERRFQKVQVNPSSPEETLQILKNLKGRYEDFHHVTYTEEALEACVKLTGRFMNERCFPDKAIDAMDEAGSRLHIQDRPLPEKITSLEARIKELQAKKMQAAQNQNFELAADYRDEAKHLQAELDEAQQKWEKSDANPRLEVDENIVAEVVSKMTGIPVQRVGQEENERLRKLKEILLKKVIGQDDAVATIARAIQRSRIGLKDPKRPIGTFIFVGPTGVGKTYLTKCLAEEMFGDADAIIRLDMSEYMEKHTVSRMVGAPPGYVGYEEGGQLTERVRRKPYSIVLLDEIEKAHPDVFNILLQVMDEGRLTDGNGNTIDFRNTIIIMTSNCGTRQINEFGKGIGFHSAADNMQNEANYHSMVMKALSKQFAPEFLNRLDEVVFFSQLNADALQRIVDIELAPLVSRVHDMGHILNVTLAARQLLAKRGYDVKYGARPLRRAIQNLLENPLCEILLQENIASDAQLTADIEEEKKDGQTGSKQEDTRLAITAN